MNIILDLIVLGLIVLFAWLGKTRGFVKTVFSFFGSLLSFLLASFFAKPIGAFVSEKALFPAMKAYFVKVFTENIEFPDSLFDFSQLSESSKAILENFQITEDKLSQFSIQAEDSFVTGINKMADSVLAPISEAVAYAISYFVLFLLFSLAIKILVRVFNLFDKLPLIHFSNHFFGLIVGLLWGLLIAFLVSNLLSLVEPMLFDGTGSFWNQIDLDKTILIKWFSSGDFFSYFIIER